MNDLETLTNFIYSPVFQGLTESARKELLEQQRTQVRALIESAINEHIKPIIEKYDVGFDVNVVERSIEEEENKNDTTASSNETQDETEQSDGGDNETIISRSKSIGFTVHFSDGTEIHESEAIDTFIKSLQKMNLRKVSLLENIRTFAGYPLVGTIKRTDGNKCWQREVEGWQIYINMSNETKISVLKEVADELGIEIAITKDEDKDDKEDNSLSLSTFIFHSKRVNKMVLEIFKRISSKGELNKLLPYMKQVAERPNRSLKMQDTFELTNVLLNASINEVKQRNSENQRWYETPFTIGDKTYYLSTQWRNDGKTGLQFGQFKLLLDYLYPQMFYIVEEGNDLYLKEL